MALLKQITDEKGVITSYHRIERVVIFASGKVKIRILSYANEEKRMEEKDAVDTKKQDEIVSLIEELEKNALLTKSEDKAEKINSEIEAYRMELAKLHSKNILIDTSIHDMWFEFSDVDITKTLNYTDAYNLLKTLEDFADAEDLFEED